MENKEQEVKLEDLFWEIEKTIDSLNSKEISLEESFLQYRQGMDLLKQCNEKIDTIEKKVMEISGNGQLSEF